MFKIRTDLALEEREEIKGNAEEITGVAFQEVEKECGIKITKVCIRNRKGAAVMKKPAGTYITLEASALSHSSPEEREKMAGEMACSLEEMVKHIREKEGRLQSVLAVGLGNEKITADALGPQVMAGLRIRRKEEGHIPAVNSIVPGVMAQTGMESAEIVRGIVKETSPDLVVVVDALAARSITRLGTTIQLTDTGIWPGSGVGNHRGKLTKESLGVPVIAIGVPTVVGAAAIVFDTVDALEEALRQSGMEFASREMESMSKEARYALIRELLEPKFGPMFVTPKDIDHTVKNLSETISMGINKAMSGIHT